jgi:hypothetical protein
MNKKAIFILSMATTFLFFSCKDDVLRDKRIDGTWKVNQYRIGADTILPNTQGSSNSVTYVFDKDGDFSQKYTYSYVGSSTYDVTFTGNWDNSDGDLELNFDSNSQGVLSIGSGSSFNNYYCGSYYNLREVFDIIQLKGDNLEMETTINGKRVYVKATKQ